MKNFMELFGWYGTIAIVTAYALVSFSVLQSTDIAYQILNGTGALGIVLVSFRKRAYQPGVLNIIWTLIAVVAIFKILL
jgi:multidrug transporter EmrE-like cation transporter